MAEKNISKLPPPLKFQTMDESLEFIFMTMINQGEYFDAVDFIRSIPVQFLPSKTMMKTLIFEIMMKNDHARTLACTSNYLTTVIKAYPPINEERRKFYLDSVRDSHGFLADLWNIFSHLVNSYYIDRNIYIKEEKEGMTSDPVKYPNCKFLLDFYIELFVKDFEYFQSENNTTCLVMELFWPNSDTRTISLSNRTDLLFKWLNDIYASVLVNEMDLLPDRMHQMVDLVVRCIIEGKHKLSSPCAAFSSTALAEIVEAILNFCSSAFSNVSNVKMFLVSVKLKYLRATVSEKVVKQVIRVSSRRFCVLTLQDVIDQCMFPSKTNKLKFKLESSREINLRPRTVDKKYFADMKMETTKLHELCRKNRFADLFEELRFSSEDINARDPAGNTPLHEACSIGSRLCVKHLIDEGIVLEHLTLDLANPPL